MHHRPVTTMINLSASLSFALSHPTHPRATPSLTPASRATPRRRPSRSREITVLSPRARPVLHAGGGSSLSTRRRLSELAEAPPSPSAPPPSWADRAPVLPDLVSRRLDLTGGVWIRPLAHSSGGDHFFMFSVRNVVAGFWLGSSGTFSFSDGFISATKFFSLIVIMA